MNILIHSLEHGYVITDHDSGKKYAKETAGGVIEVIKEALGISMNPAMTSDVKLERPETEINSQSKIERLGRARLQMYGLQMNRSPDSPLPTPEPKPEPTACQKIKELAQMKDNLLSDNKSLTKNGLLIPRFKYDPWQAQKKEIEGYSNISVMELPDGRAMIQYKGTHYYTTKEKVMQIPYPTPYSYFKRPGLGVSATAQTCLRAYRKLLANNLLSADKSLTKTDDVRDQATECLGDEQGTCNDIIFDSCANNSPENCKFCVNQSRFEDKNKLRSRNQRPLMHATIEP